MEYIMQACIYVCNMVYSAAGMQCTVGLLQICSKKHLGADK